jgi:signal transduction histidine kinase/putative methionine-R-sulfoxide reductase with GAF domain
VRSEAETSDERLERRIRELTLALRREERISRVLREVGSALGSTLDLDALLELILNKLTELVEADRSTLYLLDESRQELVSRYVVGEQVKSIRMKIGHGLAGTVAKGGKAVRVRRAYEDPRFERDWDILTGYKTTSMLAAPLKNHLGRTIGVIQVLNKQGGEEFTDEDEAIVSSLSMQAAVAIDNSRLFLSLIQKNKQLSDTTEQLERRVRDLSLLFDLERAMARVTTIEDLVRACLDRLIDACDARGGAVLLAADDSGDLVAYGQPSDPFAELFRVGIKSGEGILGSVAASSEPLLASGEEMPAISPRFEGRFEFPIKSVLSVPLDGETQTIGAIALYNKRDDGAFAQEDFAILRLVAANVSTAVRLFSASTAREREERLTTIGRLLSQVTHDFKSPMTVISGYVQLMAEADDHAKRQEYSEVILRQFDQLTAMQREVLEFARGERSIFVRKVFMRKFFADIAHEIELELARRPIELQMVVDSKLVARFDEGRVARALHNLSRNAIEAMGDAGGRLTIEARLEGSDLVIVVRDTGPGIPAEIEGRLFQSFVTMGKKDGTGLGLAIVKKIAEEHGGSVGVSSSAQGAAFVLRLPQPSRESPQAERGKKSRPSQRQGGLPKNQ